MKKYFKGRRKKGFTLMELLVSLGIIAALSMMVAPTIIGKIEEAKEKTDIANANAIALAVKSEMIEGKEVADGTSGDDLTTLIGKYFDGKIPSPQSVEGGNFSIDITGKNIKVMVDKDQFYPEYIKAPSTP